MARCGSRLRQVRRFGAPFLAPGVASATVKAQSARYRPATDLSPRLLRASTPGLSDYWPHGATAQAYGAFNEERGAANRYTFVLDAGGVVREVINTESLGIAREFEAYAEALAKV